MLDSVLTKLLAVVGLISMWFGYLVVIINSSDIEHIEYIVSSDDISNYSVSLTKLGVLESKKKYFFKVIFFTKVSVISIFVTASVAR